MPTLTLTARAVGSLKPMYGKRVECFDAAVSGLALRVSERGAKSWTLLYRHRGRQRRLTLGSAAVLSLADARKRVRDLLHDVSKGADPTTEKQDSRCAKTIADLAELYVEKWAKPKKRSWKADENLLEHEVLPHRRHRAIANIIRQDVRALLIVDLVMATLVVDATLLTAWLLTAVLTMSLGVGIALATFVLEPATTRSALGMCD